MLILYENEFCPVLISDVEPASETEEELVSRVITIMEEHTDWTKFDLARELKWSENKVQLFIKKHALPYQLQRGKQKVLNPEDVMAFMADHPDMSLSKLAAHFGVATSNMLSYMKTHGIMKGGLLVKKVIGKHPSGRSVVIQKGESEKRYIYETFLGTGEATTWQTARDAARRTSFTEAEKQQGLDKGNWNWRAFD